MIKVVYKKPNELPIILEVDNTLEKFQELVGGYIEVVAAKEDASIIAIVNEEGKLEGLKPNIWIGNELIVGNVVFVKNSDDGEFHSLTDDMIKEIVESFS